MHRPGLPTSIFMIASELASNRSRGWIGTFFLLSSDFFELEPCNLLNRARVAGSGEVPVPVVSFHSQIDRHYAEQVVGEQYVTNHGKAGRASSHWELKHPKQRVEALDTANYARAAAA